MRPAVATYLSSSVTACMSDSCGNSATGTRRLGKGAARTARAAGSRLRRWISSHDALCRRMSRGVCHGYHPTAVAAEKLFAFHCGHLPGRKDFLLSSPLSCSKGGEGQKQTVSLLAF